MRAFVFDHAELLSMDERTLNLLIKLLTPELIVKLDRVISSDEFQSYKDDYTLADSIEFLEEKLERFIRPVAFAQELKNKPFPDSDISYFQAFSSDFNILFDKVTLFAMDIDKLEEIEETLEEFVKMLPLLPTHYKAGRKADFEEFCKCIKETVVPFAVTLNIRKGIPYNKNIMKEIKNNKIVLYDKNALTRPSGYSYAASKSETLKIFLEGCKWNIYCRKNNISDDKKYNFIL